MIIELLQLSKRCPMANSGVGLSAGRHVSEYWVQVSDGHCIMQARLNGAEWREWLAEIAKIRQGQRAAVIEGVVKEE